MNIKTVLAREQAFIDSGARCAARSVATGVYLS